VTPRQRLIESRKILEHLMDDVGLTQSDIARELNVTEKTVNRWWRAVSNPSLTHYIALVGLQTPEEKEE
jgi:transcriptional regulator with XRE-family HTH domain